MYNIQYIFSCVFIKCMHIQMYRYNTRKSCSLLLRPKSGQLPIYNLFMYILHVCVCTVHICYCVYIQCINIHMYRYNTRKLCMLLVRPKSGQINIYYVYLYPRICICIHVCGHVYTYIYIYTYMCTHIYTYIYIYIYLCTYLPKDGLIALWPFVDGQSATFQYCQVVFCQIRDY